MSTQVKINKLRAFVDSDSNYGNPTGIVLDLEQKLGELVRQKIATTLHFTDTVFINSLTPLEVSFFNPEQETKFAGDSLISTSFFAHNILHQNLDSIECKGGHITTWFDDSRAFWIEASLDGTPGWNHLQLPDPESVVSITSEQAETYEHTMVWAWEDEKRGLIISRTFLPDWGTLEDQGNGSGSMQLAAMIGRPIEIHQGKGSVIYAAASSRVRARVGGRVAVDQPATLSI